MQKIFIFLFFILAPGVGMADQLNHNWKIEIQSSFTNLDGNVQVYTKGMKYDYGNYYQLFISDKWDCRFTPRSGGLNQLTYEIIEVACGLKSDKKFTPFVFNATRCQSDLPASKSGFKLHEGDDFMFIYSECSRGRFTQ